MKQLDIVIPVKDEAKTIGELVERIDTTCTQASISYTCIFVDDHSQDGTPALLTKLQKKYPIKILTKKGRAGKAFSIIEGSQAATAPYIAVIDADLQYPPESLPKLLKETQLSGVVVARRKYQNTKPLRTIMSKSARFLLGKLLFGFDYDILSGLKVFKRDIIVHIDSNTISPWTLDVPLIDTALELGYTISEVEVAFQNRKRGTSKHNLVFDTSDVIQHTIGYKLKRKTPLKIVPDNGPGMTGAGLMYKRKRYITHTTLNHNQSALETISLLQRFGIASLLVLTCFGIAFHAHTTAIVAVAILSSIYFVDVLFNLFLILKSLHQPPEIQISAQSLAKLKETELPIYTILCPLYKEAHVLPQFLKSIASLDWPHKKLNVILLLEADDTTTIKAAQAMKLPNYVQILVVPDSQPKTKPKACNYGLAYAKGEYLVIYDAEDMPDPQQLKKVYCAFQNSNANIKCIQAKLNYYNPSQNLLTRFFTAEYSLWFDVILTGLQSIQTTIPLGGTSNHFRTKELLELQGWDPFNVTEDCDLGIRLFKRGARTAVIDSVTLEEANSDWKNWLRQRSRWIKGYMQTYLLHMRNPIELFRTQGIHALIFQLSIGGKIAFLLINPLMWVLTIAYFFLYMYVGPLIESLYPTVIFYMAATSLVFGNFMFIYYYMIGIAKREHWSVMKYVLLVPFYWLMTSVAAVIGLYQLIVKPHYWEKTVHGLHLKAQELEKKAEHAATVVAAEIVSEGITETKATSTQQIGKRLPNLELIQNLVKQVEGLPFTSVLKRFSGKKYRGGALVVLASFFANFANMATNFYIGEELSVKEFALITTYTSLVYLFSVPVRAFTNTINHNTALLLGKHNRSSLHSFWLHLKGRMNLLALISVIIWLLCTPLIAKFLNFDSIVPLLVFSLVILAGLLGSVNEGYLNGRLYFSAVAAVIIIEPIVRLITAVVLGESRFQPLVYLAIPAGIIAATLTSKYFAKTKDESNAEFEVSLKEFRLPKTFLFIALVTRLSTIAFFSVDALILAHYFDSDMLGTYGLLSLFGKMIFFAGSTISSFMLPLVANREGKGKSSKDILSKVLIITSLFSTAMYLVIGFGLPLIAPYFFGDKVSLIAPYLPLYGFGILCFTITQTLVQYHLAKKEYLFALTSFGFSLLESIGLYYFHASVWQAVTVLVVTGIATSAALFSEHFFYTHLKETLSNIFELIFKKSPAQSSLRKKNTLSFLILNWRDPRHKWAGGAEEYVFEIAKELVNKGHSVTLFCSNDGRLSRYEKNQGVQIIRRGNFVTVYIWAMIYYILKLKKTTDVVIDCENGIPFLTPLYVRKPIYLAVHHVHQEVFYNHLKFPFSELASYIEADLMPTLYEHTHILTVSESSKNEIEKLGLGQTTSITVIKPGIAEYFHKKNTYKKTSNPSFCYVGRLQAYKNVDILLKAFVAVKEKYPTALLQIAGTGTEQKTLSELHTKLNLQDSVKLLGRISEAEKLKLLSESWAALQPSSLEGWGITVIEASSCGTPVIASNVPGLKDSVQEGTNGMLVSPRKISEWSEAMLDIVSNTKKLATISKTAKIFAQKFTWENTTKQLLHVVMNTESSEKKIPSTEHNYI